MIAPFRVMLVMMALLTAVAAAGADTAAEPQPTQRYILGEDGAWRPVDQAGDEPAAASADAQLDELRRLLADEKYRQVEQRAGRWIDGYPRHPRQAEAHMIRGEARRLRSHLYRSLYDYEYVIRRHLDTELFHVAMEREYEIANRFLAGERRRLLGLPILPARGEGEELLIRIQERAPGSSLAERAGHDLADYYFSRRRWEEAAEAYDVFLDLYPRSADRAHARQRLVEANVNRWRGPAYDPAGLIEAQQRLAALTREFPALAQQMDAEAVDRELDEKLASNREHSARWYVQRGERVSAAYVYDRLARQFPDTEAGERARAWLEALDDPHVERVLPADWRDGEAGP
ncbi:MAG: outer membrane protein assembly factor BamD [Phycisphaeraceae bacterium]